LKSTVGQQKAITIDPEKGNQIIFGGSHTAFDEIVAKVMSSLGFSYKDNKVTIPFRRSPDDMNIPEDIYEEIARIYGYDSIEAKALIGPTGYMPYTAEVALQRTVETYLIHDARMDQVETYPWADEKTYAYFGNSNQEHYTIINPSSPETSKLRPDMIYSMMEIVEKNHRTFDEIKAFDTGKIRPSADKRLVEMKALGMIAYRKTVNSRQEDTVLDMKSHVIGLLQKLGVTEIAFPTTTESHFHPKKQAHIMADGEMIGYIATIHPLVQQNYKIPETAQVSVASLDMEKLQKYMTGSNENNNEYNTLQDQIVYRDVCFVLDKDKTRDSVLDPIRKLQNISDINIFDIYA